MKILADENMDAGIIEWLRSLGEDVLAVRESMRSADDVAILRTANTEDRIILTKDMDFGEMVFSQGMSAVGIVLLRLENAVTQKRLSVMQSNWDEVKQRARGNFVVLTEDRLRVRSLRQTRN